MKKAIILLLIFGSGSGLYADSGFEGRPIIHNISMPTGYILGKGEVALGLGPIGSGMSDKVQVGTNMLLFLARNYNINVKTSVLETNEAALALGVELRQFYMDVNQISTAFVSASPFIAYSRKIGPNTDLHLSYFLSYINDDYKLKNAEVKAISEGTFLSGGISYSHSNRTKFLAETGYDTTFDGFRLAGAVLFGWTTFRLKLGLSYFNPSGLADNSISPVIGLWWRFGGND